MRIRTIIIGISLFIVVGVSASFLVFSYGVSKEQEYLRSLSAEQFQSYENIQNGLKELKTGDLLINKQGKVYIETVEECF